jgi:hypothetical protein
MPNMRLLSFLGLLATATGPAFAEPAAVQMVIIGSQSNGTFVASALSISAGAGGSTVRGYHADPESGTVGTSVMVQEDSSVDGGSLQGYETIICTSASCPLTTETAP